MKLFSRLRRGLSGLPGDDPSEGAPGGSPGGSPSGPSGDLADDLREGLSGNLREGLAGGANELGRDDLLGEIVRGIAELARRGARGSVVLPAAVAIDISVPDRGLEVVRGFVADPEFDREVDARLTNRIGQDLAAGPPLRRYRVVAGTRRRIQVREGRAPALGLLVEDGDFAGRFLPLPASRRSLRLGRGDRVGSDGAANDLVVTDALPFVSRRAARLHRSGAALAVSTLDQGDCLVVVRQDGQRLRPARTASGRVSLSEGDRIELSDGGKVCLGLRVAREVEALVTPELEPEELEPEELEPEELEPEEQEPEEPSP